MERLICNCFDSDNQGCNPEPCPIHLPDDVPLSAEEIEAEESNQTPWANTKGD